MSADDLQLNADAAKGMQAQSLLDNSIIAEAYEKIEADLIAAWINSPPRDTDGRERLFHAVHANRKHRDYLQSVVSNGKLAAAELTELAKKR